MRSGRLLAVVGLGLLLALLQVPAATARAEQEDNDEEAMLDGALRQVLAAATRPTELREHVKKVVAVQDGGHPELLGGAADCDLALARWAAGLVSLETWALQMVDSSSKLLTGLLYGNLADLGNFDECVSSMPPGDATFSGRYAFPALSVQTRKDAAPTKLRTALARMSGPGHKMKPVNSSDPEYTTLLPLNIAVCVPSACEAPLLEKTLNSVLGVVNGYLEKSGYRLQGRLKETDTSTNRAWRDMDLADGVVISICVVLLLLVFTGTVIDMAIGQKDKVLRGKVAVLLAFSGLTNGRRLLTIAPPSDTNFTCINGIRFLSVAWVILGHRYRYALDVPFMNLAVIPKRVTDVSAMAIASAPLSVDTFFVIGGMVNCYSFMKAVQGRRSFSILMFYVHRYIRLTPAFALMIGITATWLNLIGSGPLWVLVAGDAGERCRRNWWTGLLYVGNYVEATQQCMMQSWYLMVDMQMHILSPLVLIPLWKWRRIGLSWLGVVIIVSCAVPFAVSYVNHYRTPISTELNAASQLSFMQDMYFPTHTRFTSYVLGILAGYVLFLLKTGKLQWRLSRNAVVLGWSMSFAVCMAVVFGAQPLFDTENHAYNVWESSIYLGFYRLGWAFGISWVVMACIMGSGGPVNAFLSWPPLIVLGRLTYGIYLTHAAVQIVDVGTMRSSEYYSDYRMVQRTLSDALLGAFFGACLCLTTESPISSIEKVLLGPRRERTPEKYAVQNGATPDPDTKDGVDNTAFEADDAKPCFDVAAATVAEQAIDALPTDATVVVAVQAVNDALVEDGPSDGPADGIEVNPQRPATEAV